MRFRAQKGRGPNNLWSGLSESEKILKIVEFQEIILTQWFKSTTGVQQLMARNVGAPSAMCINKYVIMLLK